MDVVKSFLTIFTIELSIRMTMLTFRLLGQSLKRASIS